MDKWRDGREGRTETDNADETPQVPDVHYDMEPLSRIREQYAQFRTLARDDSVWEECPVVGLMVASVVAPEFIAEIERIIARTRIGKPGGGIVDSLYFAKNPHVVEYVRRRSPGEFGAREEDIPSDFHHTRVTNLTRLMSLTAATVAEVTEPAEIAEHQEVHRCVPVALNMARVSP